MSHFTIWCKFSKYLFESLKEERVKISTNFNKRLLGGNKIVIFPCVQLFAKIWSQFLESFSIHFHWEDKGSILIFETDFVPKSFKFFTELVQKFEESHVGRNHFLVDFDWVRLVVCNRIVHFDFD